MCGRQDVHPTKVSCHDANYATIANTDARVMFVNPAYAGNLGQVNSRSAQLQVLQNSYLVSARVSPSPFISLSGAVSITTLEGLSGSGWLRQRPQKKLQDSLCDQDMRAIAHGIPRLSHYYSVGSWPTFAPS